MIRTKIVATIGPASSDEATVGALVDAGMDVARLNLSHGDLGEHFAVLRRVRAAADRARRSVGVLADLPGPKPRTADLGTDGLVLDDGETWRLVTGAGDGRPATHHVIPIDDADVLDQVAPGDEIVLGDAVATLHVTAVDRTGATAVVRAGGHLRGRPGVRVLGAARPGRVPTSRDVQLLDAMVDAEVDYIGVSFVLGPDDIRRVRDRVRHHGGRPPMLVAKIETAEAADAIEAVVAAADAVMVARGDLGAQCPLEDVPHLQKQIIDVAVRYAKPVITATQMLESMTTADEPTRAEVSDVANAVLDGTDAVMLSGETAIGVDPVRVVTTMRRIASRADVAARDASGAGRAARRTPDASVDARVTDAIADAARVVAADVGATAILCCTRTGATARAIARTRPAARLIGLTDDERTRRALAISWGVEPLTMAGPITDIDAAVRTATEAGCVRSGDLVAVVAGIPDSLRVVEVP